MLLVTTLRWTLERLFPIRQDAVRALPEIEEQVFAQLEAAAALLNVNPVASASAVEPQGPELLALRREGALVDPRDRGGLGEVALDRVK